MNTLPPTHTHLHTQVTNNYIVPDMAIISLHDTELATENNLLLYRVEHHREIILLSSQYINIVYYN